VGKRSKFGRCWSKVVGQARSKAARQRGLPENLKKYLEARKQAKVEASKPASESRKPQTERAKRVKKQFSPKKM
jgi:hypothetical protein